MSLVLGAATSDKVLFGAPGTGLANMDPMTMLVWVYISVMTNGKRIYSRADDGGIRRTLLLSGTTGNVQWVSAGTTSTNFITNTTPLAGLGVWHFMAVTWTSAPATHIYHGTLDKPAVECGYGTSTAGSGFTAETTNPASAWGNRAIVTPVNALEGGIDDGALYNRVLTLSEIIQWQQQAQLFPGCVAWNTLGENGTQKQLDKSGNKNDGTVTGAVVGQSCPGYRRSGQSRLFVPATTSVTVPWALFQRKAA